jgi:predicted RNA-binding protein with RPS1 domain
MYYYNTTAIRKDLSQEIPSMNVQVISAEKSGQTSLVIRLAKNEFSNQKSYEDLNTKT